MMHPVIKAYIGTVLSALACGTEQEVFAKLDFMYNYWVKEYETREAD
jgi:hypothetical protein